MASNNKEELLQEEQSTRLDVQSSNIKEQCSICLAPLLERSTSNKCRECTEKINAVPTGFQFVIAGQDRKEFECPICLCIIRDATDLGCEHIMCGKCLERYEHDQKERLKENAKFYCSICQTEYKPEEKNWVKSLDRLIQTTVPVKCLRKQCDWVGCIKDYKFHEPKCSHQLVQCSYYDFGCQSNVERRNLEKHNQAKHGAHQLMLLDTIQRLSRDRQEDQQQIIKLTTDREEDQQQIIKLTTDREEDRQQIIKLTTDRLEDRQQMKEQAKQITSLQSELTNKYNQLNELQIEINSIYDRVESQASVIQVNAQKVAQIESKLDNKDSKADGEQQRDQTTRIEKIEKSLDDQSVEIKHLKTFADRASKLHKTLSNPAVNDKFDSCMHVTGERVMEESEKKWYDLVDAVNEEDDDDDDCFYLETLNDAIKEYSESFVFPKDWEAKYDKLIFDLNEGDILKGVIKLPCYQQEYISLKTFIDIDEFNKELSIQNKWFHISSYVASAIDVDNSCTNFILFYTDKIEDCCLLHVNEEDKEVKVTVDGTKFELEDGFLYDEDSFIIIKLVKFDLMNSFLDDAGLDEV